MVYIIYTMTQRIYGWYSNTQLKNMIDKQFSKPYIYYTDIYGTIVQVTEVKNYKCKVTFEDGYSLGELSKFYCNSETPLNLQQLNTQTQ